MIKPSEFQRFLVENNSLPLKKSIIKLFQTNPKMTDDIVHKFAEDNGYDKDEVENEIYKMLGNIISSGKSFNTEAKYNPDQLKMGIKIEQEHTKDPDIAEKIAKDHLIEDPFYYDHLKKMEDQNQDNQNQQDEPDDEDNKENENNEKEDEEENDNEENDNEENDNEENDNEENDKDDEYSKENYPPKMTDKDKKYKIKNMEETVHFSDYLKKSGMQDDNK